MSDQENQQSSILGPSMYAPQLQGSGNGASPNGAPPPEKKLDWVNIIKDICVVIVALALIGAVGYAVWHGLDENGFFDSSSSRKKKKKSDDEETVQVIDHILGCPVDLSRIQTIAAGPVKGMNNSAFSNMTLADLESFFKQQGLTTMSQDSGIMAYNDDLNLIVSVIVVSEEMSFDELVDTVFSNSEMFINDWEEQDGVMVNEGYMDPDSPDLGYAYTAMIVLKDKVVVVQGLGNSSSDRVVADAKDLVDTLVKKLEK